jgi:hypothetical protein
MWRKIVDRQLVTDLKGHLHRQASMKRGKETYNKAAPATIIPFRIERRWKTQDSILGFCLALRLRSLIAVALDDSLAGGCIL